MSRYFGIHYGKSRNTNFKVIVHSNLAGGYFGLGELGIHCGKTTISNFKHQMVSTCCLYAAAAAYKRHVDTIWLRILLGIL